MTSFKLSDEQVRSEWRNLRREGKNLDQELDNIINNISQVDTQFELIDMLNIQCTIDDIHPIKADLDLQITHLKMFGSKFMEWVTKVDEWHRRCAAGNLKAAVKWVAKKENITTHAEFDAFCGNRRIYGKRVNRQKMHDAVRAVYTCELVSTHKLRKTYEKMDFWKK